MNTTLLLSTTYFGPVQWYQKLYRAQRVEIEQWESFQKQTYRNRCVIATANGLQALTVPIERHTVAAGTPSPGPDSSHNDADTAITIRDIRISDHGNWRHLHWQALASAYGDSPFFEYYQDDLRPFFERRWTFLFDFNEAIRHTLCQLLDIQPNVALTQAYAPHAQGDYRQAISPKHQQPDPDFTPRPYYQVYQQRHGFQPNLSVLDLLFNMGPEAILWL